MVVEAVTSIKMRQPVNNHENMRLSVTKRTLLAVLTSTDRLTSSAIGMWEYPAFFDAKLPSEWVIASIYSGQAARSGTSITANVEPAPAQRIEKQLKIYVSDRGVRFILQIATDV